jgi:hypothetical protein
MERKRMKGRFVAEDGAAGEGDAGQKPRRAGAPRPRYCRTFTRARVAEALPEIVDRFAEEAKNGSIAHAKVLMKIGGLDTGEVLPKAAAKRRGKSVIQVLLENLKDDKELKAEKKPLVLEQQAEVREPLAIGPGPTDRASNEEEAATPAKPEA